MARQTGTRNNSKKTTAKPEENNKNVIKMPNIEDKTTTEQTDSYTFSAEDQATFNEMLDLGIERKFPMDQEEVDKFGEMLKNELRKHIASKPPEITAKIKAKLTEEHKDSANPELGFIGAGNMGGTIINALKKHYDIFVSRKNIEALRKMTGVTPCDENIIAVRDITFLAVKPDMYKDILLEIRDELLNSNSVLVSMAAGVSMEEIKNRLCFDVKLVRIMPNVNASVGMSVTAVCRNEFVTDDEYKSVNKILSRFGKVVDISEDQFGIFSAIAGCSPAYVYTFIDALARGAQKMGMKKELALEIAAEAVKGSAVMLEKSNMHPQSLVDKVCSPGGTTIEGLCTLDEYKFTAGIVKAVENIVNKDKNISGE